ncbi:MAG TPA: NfuA family Fe-S biogenesis protein [Rhodanobacteraceae bacterium]|nr:NfuA family Fe-S biogenesis protein [Rhodanobacteraceae bacterium]
MINISDSAQTHFRKLIAMQGGDDLGIRLRARNPGSPAADCELEFCDAGERNGDDWVIECAGFNLYVDSASASWLDTAQIDYKSTPTGGELAIHAPKLRGHAPEADASLAIRVQYLLEAQINPKLASHGGHVRLDSVSADNEVVLRFGGGCQGCGMASVTMKQGVEKTLREHFPEITAVRDATDHAAGHSPYYKGREGKSAVG